MSGRPDFPKMEEEILAFWKKENIFKKTLEKTANGRRFVFFEGPPTANGKPGIHHVESRAFKDLIPRYKTMQGYFADRKAGWDTHGLPVEIEVEKSQGISGKKDIESLKDTPRESIAYFNQLCRESVWKYLEDWTALTERIGFWVDLEHPYVTYHNEYIESLWWIVKKIHDRGLLYKDYKVVPYCARCGTPLSSHELAQGYQDVEDTAVFVKFKIRNSKSETPTYILAWTTTPWTLPGNLALAVREDVDYVKIAIKRLSDGVIEHLIVAKARLSVIDEVYEIVEEYKGKDLVGIQYEPLYSFVTYDEKTHYVAPADFVSTEDGTGVVHTAVMYGVEDFELGQRIGLPKKHLVDEDGKFISDVTPWAGKFVKEADPDIIKDLRDRGLLYKEEKITHTYPFCWRCKTPLLYYAKDSWFVKMSALREELIARNQSINWVPDYIKEGRFGEWLREVKDWAFSRERYWGTPLPVWECEKCDNKKVVGGFEEFPTRANNNTYYILRHGHADHNEKGIVTDNLDFPSHLTEKGKEQLEQTAKELARLGGFDFVVASPSIRTRETVEALRMVLPSEITYDGRLTDIDFGSYEGKSIPEWEAFFEHPMQKFEKAPEGAETWTDLTRRMHGVLKDIDAQHKGKRILIVSHGDPLMMLEATCKGMSRVGIVSYLYEKDHKDANKKNYIRTGEVRELVFRNLPFDEDGFVNPHKPYVDDITFDCACGGVMHRTPEVVDVWFDSGCMPFAQWHYPFENKEKIDTGEAYPADYISEAIDQTRGWFYTLLAVATLLKKEAPYKNVINLGHLVDPKGKKMSKSIGNVVDPWEMVRTYGADAVRFFMYTVTQPGDTKRFDPKDLDQIVKQQFMILWNVLAFWKLYTNGQNQKSEIKNLKSKDVMDQWILARLHLLTRIVTERLDAYDVTPAGRAIAEFITDLSTWYVRRSRDRFKEGSEEAVATLGYVLQNLAKLMAPFTPFIADSLYQEVTTSYILHPTYSSVHLADWPKTGKIDEKLLEEMQTVRNAAELGHALRAEQKMRVRQPLQKIELQEGKRETRNELLAILADELNVKEVEVVDEVKEKQGYAIRTDKGVGVALCLEMTPELRDEGWAREIIRYVNALRKESGLTINDRIRVLYETRDVETGEVFKKFEEELKSGTLSDVVIEGKDGEGKELQLGDKEIWVGIQKV